MYLFKVGEGICHNTWEGQDNLQELIPSFQKTMVTCCRAVGNALTICILLGQGRLPSLSRGMQIFSPFKQHTFLVP